MAIDKFPVKNLIQEVVVTTARFSGVMEEKIFIPKLQKINDELHGMFELSLSQEEIDVIKNNITANEKPKVTLLTNVEAKNLVEFKAIWNYAPDCKIDIMHSQSDDYDQLPFIDIIITREFEGYILSLNITTTFNGDKVIKRLLLKPKQGLEKKSEFAFTLNDREVRSAGFTGDSVSLARTHLEHAFTKVNLNSMIDNVDYRERKYQFFRKQLFNLDA